jgi:nitrate reductase delta subunit
VNCERIAPLLRYPDARFAENLDNARPLAGAVEEFARETASLDLPALQAIYTATFDLAPACSPYLGVHLFDEDGRDRARLMVGLRMRGVSGEGRELPDHVAEVIASAEKFDAEEWRDLVRLVLQPALSRMETILSGTANPFRHLIAAARQSLRDGGTA